MTTEIQHKIENSFAQQAMMETLGARLTHIGEGEVEITAPILPCAMQQNGFGHAGLTFSIGDSAAGYAALSLMPPEADVLTSEIKINLLAPAKGDVLIARGRVIKPGRRLIVAQSDVYARIGDSERHIATLLGTMIPMMPT